jgi:hypothetical protein
MGILENVLRFKEPVTSLVTSLAMKACGFVGLEPETQINTILKLLGILFRLRAALVVVLSFPVHCKHIHYVFRANWPSSSVKLNLARQLLRLQVIFRFVVRCGNGPVQSYGFVARVLALYSCVAFLYIFSCCIRGTLVAYYRNEKMKSEQQSQLHLASKGVPKSQI